MKLSGSFDGILEPENAASSVASGSDDSVNNVFTVYETKSPPMGLYDVLSSGLHIKQVAELSNTLLACILVPSRTWAGGEAHGGEALEGGFVGGGELAFVVVQFDEVGGEFF